MGMAASQARLLTLTARLHDVELSAQSIESQKIALATQKDGLYDEYMEALDKTKIVVAFNNKDGTTHQVDANYSTVCTYQPNRMKQYALRNNKTGNIYVTKEEKEAYDIFNRDKYQFAWNMCGFDESCFGKINDNDPNSSVLAREIGIGTANDNEYEGYEYYDADTQSLFLTKEEAKVFEEHKDEAMLAGKYEALLEAKKENDESTKKTKMKEALESFRKALYSSYGKEIFDEMNSVKGETDDSQNLSNPYSDKSFSDISDKFNYYVHLWETIHQAGGCEVIDPDFYSGDNGDTWFNNMINAGLVSILVYDDKDTINPKWEETSVATSINSSYLSEVKDDDDLKQAELKYEHELDIINRKDKKFDLELSKLETERTAITTEMDSIKKVKDDNIDRTFGIFS